MQGEFIQVWCDTWREIWHGLANHENAPAELIGELYRELSGALKSPGSAQELAEMMDNREKSREAFENIVPGDLVGERAIIAFLEDAYELLDELGGDEMSNLYFNLLEAFINKYSLRYDLRRPCTLCPTLPGVFASLVRDLRVATTKDAHLSSLMRDFDDSIRDLRSGATDSRIKTCIQKQVNLIEALGRVSPGVTKKTLGKICDQVGTWPHEQIKEAIKNLYGFTCDYPGIRHGGTVGSALRTIELRDMVAVCILLFGFVPYLTHHIDAESVYRGT